MKKQHFEIEFPDDKVIDEQVQLIVSKGLQPNQSFFASLKGMYYQIGMKYLFHDATEIIFMVLISIAILIFIGIDIGQSLNQNGVVYSIIFILSPILYLVMVSTSYFNTKQNQTLEIEMTCKYNISQVAAFRMFIFSMMSILGNLFFILIIAFVNPAINVILAFMISTTSLFLFSTLFLYVITKVKTKKVNYIFGISWILLNLLLYKFSFEFYHLFLKNLPIYVYGIITIICTLLYANHLNKLLSFKNNERVMYHVDNT
ncbi:hypothetical protein [Bacillus alkalicellulosilyticus]|uniref:hypothetical protein n=1 Tax=Alkalihalobacterium alkalicellulosilyticum TaxID=1912214 RepID=UPI000996E381|nr:hypothetical protein [Bacillus alkalicellulosilyticus]